MKKEAVMGLDQYAHIRIKSWNPRQYSYEWRKHSCLQEFMEQVWSRKGNTEIFNCQDLVLSKDDIEKLEYQIKNGYPDCESDGGLFFGHQFQEEAVDEYKEQDLDFISRAKEALNKPGSTVTYMCWW